jgi:hypothetical protein
MMVRAKVVTLGEEDDFILLTRTARRSTFFPLAPQGG